MITSAYSDNCYEFRGLSTDTKPVDEKVSNGSVFFEMDTGKVFMFDKTVTTWVELDSTGGGSGGGGKLPENITKFKSKEITIENAARPVTTRDLISKLYFNKSLDIAAVNALLLKNKPLILSNDGRFQIGSYNTTEILIAFNAQDSTFQILTQDMVTMTEEYLFNGGAVTPDISFTGWNPNFSGELIINSYLQQLHTDNLPAINLKSVTNLCAPDPLPVKLSTKNIEFLVDNSEMQRLEKLVTSDPSSYTIIGNKPIPPFGFLSNIYVNLSFTKEDVDKFFTTKAKALRDIALSGEGIVYLFVTTSGTIGLYYALPDGNVLALTNESTGKTTVIFNSSAQFITAGGQEPLVTFDTGWNPELTVDGIALNEELNADIEIPYLSGMLSDLLSIDPDFSTKKIDVATNKFVNLKGEEVWQDHVEVKRQIQKAEHISTPIPAGTGQDLTKLFIDGLYLNDVGKTADLLKVIFDLLDGSPTYESRTLFSDYSTTVSILKIPGEKCNLPDLDYAVALYYSRRNSWFGPNLCFCYPYVSQFESWIGSNYQGKMGWVEKDLSQLDIAQNETTLTAEAAIEVSKLLSTTPIINKEYAELEESELTDRFGKKIYPKTKISQIIDDTGRPWQAGNYISLTMPVTPGDSSQNNEFILNASMISSTIQEFMEGTRAIKAIPPEAGDSVLWFTPTAKANMGDNQHIVWYTLIMSLFEMSSITLQCIYDPTDPTIVRVTILSSEILSSWSAAQLEGKLLKFYGPDGAGLAAPYIVADLSSLTKECASYSLEDAPIVPGVPVDENTTTVYFNTQLNRDQMITEAKLANDNNIGYVDLYNTWDQSGEPYDLVRCIIEENSCKIEVIPYQSGSSFYIYDSETEPNWKHSSRDVLIPRSSFNISADMTKFVKIISKEPFTGGTDKCILHPADADGNIDTTKNLYPKTIKSQLFEDDGNTALKTKTVNNESIFGDGNIDTTILTSPNGTKYRIKVDDTGALTTEKIIN